MSSWKKWAIGIAGLFIVFMVAAPGTPATPSSEPQKRQEEQPKEIPVHRTINAGMDAQTTKQCMVAASEADFDQMANDAAAKNTAAAERMIMKGTIMVLDKGTKVHVISKSAIHGAKIEILSGTYQGKTGYIAPDFLE